MSDVSLTIGDALDVLTTLPDDHYQTCVTSPPYWARRAYTDREEEIGRGNLDWYVHDLLTVFREVARVLRPDGILWLNISDTAIGSGGSGGDYNAGGTYENRDKYRQGRPIVGHYDDENGGHDVELTKGQWGMIPARVVIALQECGWLVRSEIVWDKGRSRRENPAHTRRPGERHESIFMLTRTTASRYKFHVERLAGFDKGGNVWRFGPSSGSAGKAPFPIELPYRCISLSCDPGDAVLDPFCGTGATVEAARRLGCSADGIDLDPEVVNEFVMDLNTVNVRSEW